MEFASEMGCGNVDLRINGFGMIARRSRSPMAFARIEASVGRAGGADRGAWLGPAAGATTIGLIGMG